MTRAIAVVDYCKGNLASVQRGLADCGFDARITDDPADILAADGVVLPGVGAFADAMTTMERTGQADALRRVVADGVPFLGICLGMHLLFEHGDEGCAPGERMAGLGILPGHVERMAAHDEAGVKHKIPHVGWNSVEYAGEDDCVASTVASRQPASRSLRLAPLTSAPQSPSFPGGRSRLFHSIPDSSYFYFTHSYCAVPDDPADVIATSEHAQRFACAVARGNVFGVQFHPEKSSRAGLQLLENFGRIVIYQGA